jgi:hypothetical protein
MARSRAGGWRFAGLRGVIRVEGPDTTQYRVGRAAMLNRAIDDTSPGNPMQAAPAAEW